MTYDRRVETYDRRWSSYLRDSLELARAGLFVNPEQTLLDIGCGTGQLLADVMEREPHVRAVGIDVSAGMLDVARRRLPRSGALLLGRADQLLLASASCDCIVSTSALHEFGNVPTVLDECHRVLRPGARLVVVDWCGDDFLIQAMCVWARAANRAFVHAYSGVELTELLTSHGFDDTRVRVQWSRGWRLMAVTARRV